MDNFLLNVCRRKAYEGGLRGEAPYRPRPALRSAPALGQATHLRAVKDETNREITLQRDIY